VNIKLMKAGVAEARAIVEVARAAGLGLMIGGNVETILAMTASAGFAAGLGGFLYSDLDTPLFMAENPFRGGFTLEGGRLTLDADAPGHGVEPKGAPGR
jgi:L-alanine-DL-glutamate epimerase-like enolase superfamily enzyme